MTKDERKKLCELLEKLKYCIEDGGHFLDEDELITSINIILHLISE